MFRKAGATCRRRADLFCRLAATLLEQERLYNLLAEEFSDLSPVSPNYPPNSPNAREVNDRLPELPKTEPVSPTVIPETPNLVRDTPTGNYGYPFDQIESVSPILSPTRLDYELCCDPIELSLEPSWLKEPATPN